MSTHESVKQLITLLNSKTSLQTYQALKQLANEIPLHLPVQKENSIHASVLIPIIQHPGNPTVLLTERTSHLKHHPGQISFPGGRMDEKDENAKACVLREVHEEIGLEEHQIQIIGELGQWSSFTGYMVTPFLGLITPPVILTTCQHEVEEAFEVPLEIALDINNYEQIFKETPIPHHYFEMYYKNKRIWGFTAGVMVLLASYLQDSLKEI